MRHKERDETIELGRKIYDEIVARLPAPLAPDALKRAVKTLKVEDEDALMMKIARRSVSDIDLMEALKRSLGQSGGERCKPAARTKATPAKTPAAKKAPAKKRA